jgi:hypothetical protein
VKYLVPSSPMISTPLNNSKAQFSFEKFMVPRRPSDRAILDPCRRSFLFFSGWLVNNARLAASKSSL